MSDERTEQRSAVEEVFETALFNARFLVLIPVLGILIAAIVMFVKGCIEVVQGVRAFIPALVRLRPNPQDDSGVLLSFIPAIDNYLFATILLIISMGLYELFISKIDPKTRTHHTRPDWLVVRSFDDLKGNIEEVIIMILIVNFFKLSFDIEYDQPLHLLILGGGILLIAAALVVTHYVAGLRTVRRGGSLFPAGRTDL